MIADVGSRDLAARPFVRTEVEKKTEIVAGVKGNEQ